MKSFDKLVHIMARLRGDNGCPWDRAQDIDSLKQYIIEEAYEVVDAIESGRPYAIREELGDLVLQVVFIARIAQELGWFDVDDVLNGIDAKLIHRHPHVFGDVNVHSKEDVVKNWGRQKHREKGQKVFDIPLRMPSLLASYRLLEKAERLGIRPVTINKHAAIKAGHGPKRHIKRQISDMLLSIVAISQEHAINPEDVLRETNRTLIQKVKRHAIRNTSGNRL
ncbi:MAG: MazG family protein [Deltaproteobacteria bacterium]|nr:MazG family protein [Deltaproteobacteria bacterium]